MAEDRRGAAERAKGSEGELVRAGSLLLDPQPLEHELEERRLDVLMRKRRLAHAAEVDATGCNLVEQRVDQRRLGAVAPAGKLAVSRKGPNDRRPGRAAIESLEAQ